MCVAPQIHISNKLCTALCFFGLLCLCLCVYGQLWLNIYCLCLLGSYIFRSSLAANELGQTYGRTVLCFWVCVLCCVVLCCSIRFALNCALLRAANVTNDTFPVHLQCPSVQYFVCANALWSRCVVNHVVKWSHAACYIAMRHAPLSLAYLSHSWPFHWLSWALLTWQTSHSYVAVWSAFSIITFSTDSPCDGGI